MTTAVTPVSTDETTHYLDESNPRNLVNIVPESMSKALKAIPSDYLSLTEGEWVQKFKNKPDGQSLSDEDWVIRANFWHEYNKAVATQSKIHLSGIYGSVMTFPVFDRRFLKQPDRLAFVICPMLDQVSLVREGLNRGLKIILRGLKADVVREDNTLDAKAFSGVLSAVIWLDAWQNGSIVQRTKNLNVNVEAKSPAPAPETPEELMKLAAELRKQLAGTPLGALDEKEVKDVVASTDPISD